MVVNIRVYILFLLLLSLLTACSNEQTFEEFFHKEMEENEAQYAEEVNYSYSLEHTERDAVRPGDAIAVFRENNPRGEQVFIAYFLKVDGEWKWRRTRGAEWDTPVKWSAMHKVPYIYSGAISDPDISEIFVGRERAKIIEVEGDKRFWYVNSPVKEADVRYVRDDGTEEIVEEIDREMLKDWDK
ncbi:hypothetical protein V1502_11055 [Bacillus sp. SCS-153A]|uniref:hypothetical protein n=1 Tax=Rossellomorea sedimentorum TaxID=3115294 RepID=UPI00390635B5